MAEATVKTVQYIDKRIEPQPDPLYDNVIGPTQNQFYKIPASALSNSSIHFNNLTTLGADRAYLDTFEIELTCDIDFLVRVPATLADSVGVPSTDHKDATPYLAPLMCDWVFDSFPFNKCCEEVRVNINGGGFFSQPLSYVRAKERYMNQRALSRSYENICPIHRPMLQYESGRNYTNLTGVDTKNVVGNGLVINDTNGAGEADTVAALTTNSTTGTYTNLTSVKQQGGRYYDHNSYTAALPTRYGRGMMGMLQSECMLDGGVNNSIVRTGVRATDGTERWSNIRVGTTEQIGTDHYLHVIYTVTWREPIFCSPFSSRYDATFGRPLYNITSMDLTFTLQNLGNMIRIQNVDYGLKGFTDSHDTSLNLGVWGNRTFVKNYNINILSAQLCYQVMTIPPTITKPLSTLVPYRRFVPYITDFPQNPNSGATNEALPLNGGHIQLKSGVYTLNEIPTAIWVFCAPSKSRYQENAEDCSVGVNNLPQIYVPTPTADQGHLHVALNTGEGNWDSNKLFGFMEHINISMANTTQILNTAEPVDLYRIAKYNGCEDSYLAWGVYDACAQKPCETKVAEYTTLGGSIAQSRIGMAVPRENYYGPGSVLRLIPGQDLIIPGEALIPGANAKNMVFQCEGNFYIPPHTLSQNRYALWLLFEYVGVAAISPGQCEITMNPLGDGSIMDVSPVMSGTSDESEGVLDDIGGRGNVNKAARIAAQIGDSGIISRILRLIPGAEKVADYAAQHGFGQPGSKRSKGCGISGGAVIGQGMKDWV